MRKNIIAEILGRKFKLGRASVPLWLAGLAVILVAAAAGQAVGPVLSGGALGSVGLTIEQSVVLSSNASDHSVVYASGHTGDDAIVTVNDEGSAFTAAIELHVGDTVELKLDVDNVSDALANVILELNVPGGTDVEVEEDSGSTGIAEAQLTRRSWLAKVDSGATGTLNITITTRDDLMPGFYTITGRLVQVAN